MKLKDICEKVEIYIQKNTEYAACISMGYRSERFNALIKEIESLQSSPLQAKEEYLQEYAREGVSITEKANCICAKCGENAGNSAAHTCPEDKTPRRFIDSE